MPATRRLLSLAFILALFAACGDDPADPDPGGDDDDDDPAGQTIPAEERIAAFADVQAQLSELAAQDVEGDALNEAIAAYLETRPEFADVGIDESSSVWAQFTDGRLLIVVNNLETVPAEDGAASSGASYGAVSYGAASYQMPRAGTRGRARGGVAGGGLPAGAQRAADPAELPESSHARLIHTFSSGTHFGNGSDAAISEVSAMLTDAGWTVDSPDGSVAALRAVSGDGFFYLNTHGGRGRGSMIFFDELPVYALQTGTIVTLFGEVDSQTRADLEAGRLVYMMANNAGGPDSNWLDTDIRYAITAKFIEHYMSFSANSVVFLNACYSGNPDPEVAAMADAFRAKGASVVIGWTKTVGDAIAWEGAQFIVDRMTGANRYVPEASPHRPFPLDPVVANMKALGLDQWGVGVMRLVGPSSGPAFGLLRPTIERVQIDTSAIAFPRGTLMVYGSFGSDPGEANRRVVMRDFGTDVELDVISWTPDSIRVMPVVEEATPGFTGDVVVIARGHASNPRRLHGWYGTATYRQDAIGSLELLVQMEIVARFDPDSTRARPGVAAVANDHVQVFRADPHPDVNAHWVASGQAVGEDCTMTWAGVGDIGSAGPSPGHFYNFRGRLLPGSREFELVELGLLDSGGYTVTCGPGSAQAPVQFTSIMFLSQGVLPPLTFAVDEQWRLVGEELTIAGDQASFTFAWPDAEPIPAYDPAQPR